MIAEDVGLSVGNPRRECRPGDFPCDVVACLVEDENHVVVIENQYGRTNHDHLGKLLTYAATHQAMSGIWIAEYVADDHRQVIDWLNANTPPSVNFFLCELRAYQIGDSPISPQLDLVCRPNAMVKLTREPSEADIERHAWRTDFWSEIHQHIQSANPPFRLQRPGKEHWSTIALGRQGFEICMLLTPRNQSIGVEVVVNVDGWKESAYRQLLSQRESIEREVGPLQWLPLTEKKSFKIMLEAKINPREDENRQAVKDWFAKYTPLMFQAFKDRVISLKAPARD